MTHVRTTISMAAVALLALATVLALPAAADDYTPHNPSQAVECNQVDQALAKIPHGDGVAPVTDEETGPGGWRYNTGGRSFVTFHYDLNGAGDGYDVAAGRSNTGGNSGIINDYPAVLDLPQSPDDGVKHFGKRHGEIVLDGGALFNLPGKGNGQVRIQLSDSDKDGIYEGCAKSPQLTNFGFTVKEGGPFVQQEYFKAWAETDDDGRVISYEWTEVSTFKNVTPGSN